LHIVLDGRASKEKTVATMKSKKRFPPDAGRILDILSFIENHVLPFDSGEILLILGNLKLNELSRQNVCK